MAPAGIEPATFRFVAQHLNHCATAVPVLLPAPTKITGISQLLIAALFNIQVCYIHYCYVLLAAFKQIKLHFALTKDDLFKNFIQAS